MTPSSALRVICEKHTVRRAATYLMGSDQVRSYSAQHVPQNHYDLLGIKRDASMVQVKAAYYRLSMQYHPDLNRSEDAHTLFQQILEAYEVLSNKRRRALYDQGIFVKSPHTSQGSTQRYPSVYKDMARNDQRFGKRQNAAELGQTDIYNFDEFYRQHYGASIHNRRNIRNTTEERTKEYNDLMMIQNVIRTALFLGLCWGIGLAAHSRFLK